MRKLALYFVLMFFPLSLLYSPVKGESEISISLLTKNKKVIPIYYNIQNYWTTHIKLPSIIIQNNSTDTVKISSINVMGKALGKEVIRNLLYQNDLDSVIAKVNKNFNKLMADSDFFELSNMNGDVAILDKNYRETSLLAPKELTCINLSSLIYLYYQGPTKIDELSLTVKVDIRNREKNFDFAIPLSPYVCQGDYIPPLRGTLLALSLPSSLSHRAGHSTEFAMDFADVGRDKKGNFDFNIGDTTTQSLIFHRDLLAIGNGVVVEVANRYPDSLAAVPKYFSPERMEEIEKKLKSEGVPKLNILAGNYVIIDHLNGEFSMYSHLSENTITVKPNDQVKKGQVIAKVGSTGSSNAPHLHFQLMDSKDALIANGLPFIVKNPTGIISLDIMGFSETHWPPYSDFVFMYVE
jgi:hypothetical protein